MRKPEDDRYVLIQNLPDGTPRDVRPVKSLQEGTRELDVLIERGEHGWRLFDATLEQNVNV